MLAASRGVSVHRLALAAVVHSLPGFWPVIGSTRVESVRDAMAATSDEVDDDLQQAIADDLASRGVPL
jgi:aryl-alcohol dehydrogenase-like predicted oxidoreductase